MRIEILTCPTDGQKIKFMIQKYLNLATIYGCWTELFRKSGTTKAAPRPAYELHLSAGRQTQADVKHARKDYLEVKQTRLKHVGIPTHVNGATQHL